MTNRKPYYLKPTPEMIDAKPEDIERLTRFLNWQLSITGEMYQALNAEMKGRHGNDHSISDNGQGTGASGFAGEGAPGGRPEQAD